MKTALITGITGQDGAYLAEHLLDMGYEVHGLRRRSSSFNTGRIEHLISDDQLNDRFFLHYGDMCDAVSINSLIASVRPDEVYNLAAQSHVAVSFELPEYTANSDAIGPLRLLEAIRSSGLSDHTRFYQASTSELYGAVYETPQTEKTPFHPRSPYGVAKLYGYWMTVNYREAYGMFCSNGILFNHESKLRGEIFVTRKITRALARIKLGMQDVLVLGNLDAKRDWGHAKDFVRAMQMILSHDEPDDFVIATGKQHSVRDFVSYCLDFLDFDYEWDGNGLNEVCLDKKTKNTLVRVSSKYFRPAEVDSLLGESKKASKLLGWKPEIPFETLVKEMIENDLNLESK